MEGGVAHEGHGVFVGDVERIIAEKGYKKNAVAKRVGISGQKLSDMLNGRAIIRKDNAIYRSEYGPEG